MIFSNRATARRNGGIDAMDIFMTRGGRIQSVSVKADDFKAHALRLLLIDVAVCWIVSIPTIFSALGSFMGFFLMVEIFILGFWYIRVSKKIARSYDPQPLKRVNVSALARYGRIAWCVFGAVVLGLTVYNFIRLPEADTSSLYGICRLVSEWVSPLILLSVPMMFSLIYSAALDSDPESSSRTGDVMIVILVVLGFILSYAMLFYVSPYVARTAPGYEQAQTQVQSHDISALTQYKTSGAPTEDAVGQILAQMPSADSLQTFTVSGSSVSVYYEPQASQTEDERLYIYDSVALFALIDGLQQVTFRRADSACTFYRDEVTAEYEDFASILHTSVWNSDVRDPLSEAEYVESMFDRLAHVQ